MEPPLLMRQLGCSDSRGANRLGRPSGVAGMEADLSYFRRRAVEEIRAAELSADGYVRRIHLELSRQYEQRVAKLEAEVRRAQIHVVDAD